MAVSPLKLVLERLRQSAAQDSNYFRKMTYFFELRVPAEVAIAGIVSQFLFPLIIPPESYSMEEPFTLEATPTQGGGLYVEENGIVQRMIKLEGTTGFRPRFFPTGFTASGLISPEKQSYSRVLSNFVSVNISGQKHFQYLQDSVFRTYADLKRDPATSEGTYLFFHNQKDDEHWLVAPQKFGLTRAGDKSTLYRYSIELLVVDKAEAVDADFSEEQGLLDSIKGAINMVKSGLDLIAGAINDLTALANELTTLVKDFGKIIDTATTIVDAAGNFANGITALIEAPYTILESCNGLVDAAGEALEQFEAIGADVKKVPDTVKQKLRQISDGVDRIGTHPEAFETSSQRRLREIRDSQELSTSVSKETLDAAEASDPPSTLSEVESLGTAITPGDARSAKAELGIGRSVIQYTSAREVDVNQGDTLVNLSARFLGDARLWQQIAIVNGLQPPFINDLASTPLDTDEPVFSGTLGRGSKILIPSFAKPPEKQALIPVLGVRLEEPAEVHLLGQDVALEVVAGREGAPLYDMVIDTERGSVDAKTVKGLANISQSITIRLSTEKGSDILYKRLGLARVIALNVTPLDLETVRFRIREALGQDPRISAVRNLAFEADDENIITDALVVDASVELRGFSQSTSVRTTVGG
jgi:phage baseplate assembly protein W